MTSALVFDHDKHKYTLDGAPVDGVTSILKVLDKPALVDWAAKEVAALAVDQHDRITDMLATNPAGVEPWLASAHRSTRDAAAARGTDAHYYAELLAKGADEVQIAPEHMASQPYVAAAAAFLDDFNVTTKLTETKVYSRAPRYAGTCDAVVTMGNPGHEVTAVIDWKTSKRIYPEVAWQLAAYAQAGYYVAPDGTDQPVKDLEITHAFVVRLAADGTYECCRTRLDWQIATEWQDICNVHEHVKWSTSNTRRAGNLFPPIPSPDYILD